ncbi:MAG: DUF2797 domain-containing protein [Bacteroidota bacterium]
MEITGQILKMRTEMKDPVQYRLPVGDGQIDMNALIGKHITLKYNNEIRCIFCGRKTRKSFAQGYCYPCFIDCPETAECIIRPELCRAHEGIGRDIEWERKNHLQEHFVYLAISSGLKVGVTRSTPALTRWIDQGAGKAICLAQTPNRYIAGCIEVELKKYISDRTQWQRMLKNEVQDADLGKEKLKMAKLLPCELREYLSDNNDITGINYPVNEYPEKVKSVGFDKLHQISGILDGIKGQYLIFDDGRVLNIRKHNGYVIELGC